MEIQPNKTSDVRNKVGRNEIVLFIPEDLEATTILAFSLIEKANYSLEFFIPTPKQRLQCLL